MIHNPAKIEVIIRNPGETIAPDREFGGIDGYLSSFSDYDALVKDLHKRFRFLGESDVHFFLFGVSFNLLEREKRARAHFEGSHHQHWGAAELCRRQAECGGQRCQCPLLRCSHPSESLAPPAVGGCEMDAKKDAPDLHGETTLLGDVAILVDGARNRAAAAVNSELEMLWGYGQADS